MEAINAHIHWKIRLEKYLDGTSEEKLDPKLVSRDDQCKLGKWIHGRHSSTFMMMIKHCIIYVTFMRCFMLLPPV